MNRYSHTDIRCACCGKAFSAEIPTGFFSPVCDLDGNPHNPAIFDTALMCPHCGYVSADFTEAVDSAVRDYVFSQPYQTIGQEENLTARKLLREAAIADFQNDPLRASAAWRKLAWFRREDGEEPVSEYLQAAGRLGVYLQENLNIRLALILCDCLRQAGRFEEAEDTLRELAPWITGEELKTLFLYEQRLCDSLDCAPHSESEAAE